MSAWTRSVINDSSSPVEDGQFINIPSEPNFSVDIEVLKERTRTLEGRFNERGALIKAGLAAGVTILGLLSGLVYAVKTFIIDTQNARLEQIFQMQKDYYDQLLHMKSSNLESDSISSDATSSTKP